MKTNHWMTGGIMGTALTLSSALAWGGVVAEQSTSAPTTLTVYSGTSSSTLNPSTNLNISAQTLADLTKAANYTQDNSTLAYNNSGLLNPNLGMLNLWLYTGPNWAAASTGTVSFLIGEGANHWDQNGFSLFRGGKLYFLRHDSASGNVNEASIDIPSAWQANEWHNVGISWNFGGSQSLYLDGVVKASVDCTASLTAGDTLFLGKNAGAQDWSAGGMIYDFTLYNNDTNVGDVMAAAAANTPSPIPEPAALGLLALGAALTAARRRR